LFRLYGIDDSQFDQFVDGHDVDEGDTETLLTILYRLQNVDQERVEQWAKPLDLAKIVEKPASERGEFFRLSGRVTDVEVRRVLAERAEALEFDAYYRCQCVLEDGQPAVVFTCKVPREWRKGGPVDASMAAFGAFLKLAGSAEKPTPVFAAERVAWHPETLLGKLGMDVGLYDTVVNRTRLSGLDREAFYQMLAAVGRAKPGELRDAAQAELKTADEPLVRTDRDGNRHFSVAPLFNQPDEQRGRLVVLSGNARRVLRVPVADQDIINRFGIDHYYNIYLFTDDSMDNPVVFCVRSLPQGMPIGDGPTYVEYVEIAGFFFKTWAYNIATAPGQPEKMQLAPLLIGREPVWYKSPAPMDTRLIGAIAGGLFLVAMVAIWFAVWRLGRGDQEFHNRTLSKAIAPEPAVSLNDLGLQAETEPDFSGLAEMERKAAELRKREEEERKNPPK
jgi:hypothetical protein